MIGFDFVFALFSLVLGLAVAEVLGGFASVMKLHAAARAGKARDVRVGWLTPLLAVLVTLNQLSFWMYAYLVRETLPFTYLTLLGVLVVVGAYYLFSVLVFPDDLDDWPDFDLWYDQHNRLILIGMSVINLAANGFAAAYRPARAVAASVDETVVIAAVGGTWLAFALMVTLIFVRGRRLNAVLLATLIALNLAGAVLVAAAGL